METFHPLRPLRLCGFTTAAAGVLLMLVGCGGEAPSVQAPTVGPAASLPSASGFPGDDRPLKRFHSVRFHVSIPLPDGPAWRIDDHTHRELVATHAATGSKLIFYAWPEHELVNRARCEAAARAQGFVPGGVLRTVEDLATVGPAAYDTRIWVALQSGGKPGAPLVGHVFAFGAYIRTCLLFHFTSEVPSDAYEDTLSSRLAEARVRILAGLAIDDLDAPLRERHD